MTSKRSHPYTVVIGANDSFYREELAASVEGQPGFKLIGSSPTAVQAVDLAVHCGADALVLVDESPGLLGRDVLSILAKDLPAAKVIITTRGDAPGLASANTNVFAALEDRDVNGVGVALEGLLEWFARPDARLNRRLSPDRRLTQDWAKTFAQRRIVARRTIEPAWCRSNNFAQPPDAAESPAGSAIARS